MTDIYITRKRIVLIGILALIFTGCSTSGQSIMVSDDPSGASVSSKAETPQAVEPKTGAVAATATAAPAIWFSPDLPAGFVGQIKLPDNIKKSEEAEKSGLKVVIDSSSPTARWEYALAAPFATLTDGITQTVLKQLWTSGQSADIPVKELWVTENTRDVFTALWGEPSSSAVSTAAEDRLLSRLASSTTAWAIIPFEEINPQVKIITVDGQSPLRKEFTPEAYALTVPISVQGQMTTLDQEAGVNTLFSFLPSTNRDPEKFSTLVMTGTTALVRGTASLMEVKGMDYPAEDVGDILRDADVTHMSNEVSFSPDCPPPYPWDKPLTFCSQPEYIQLIDDTGIDVIELTGDHLQDWGRAAFLYTLDLYHQKNYKLYGGGENLEEARRPLLVETNGNKLAFLGCNAKGKGYALADDNTPGTYFCDMDWMASQVKELKQKGYLPIVTFQHIEYYSYKAYPQLVPDFHRMAEAGAVIVSGSQAHQPHTMEIYQNSFLHYGLGNLFFDQYYEGFPERQAFIDRHVFYDNQYINTELITTMFADLARPRLMTPSERQDLLTSVFEAGGWTVSSPKK
jgi:poly-gamma-glutamate synthesis protein (capsule biosynthesis protein)